LWHAVHREEQIDWLAAHKTQVPHRVFLKMNSGMNRLGLRPAAFRAAWHRLSALPQVEEITLMTHFSDADGPKGIIAQMQVFEAATSDLPGERSVCNSAALLRHAGPAAGLGGVAHQSSEPTFDWVRPGIATYGAAPDHPEHSATDWGLQPAMSLATRVIGIQHLQAGDSVGYGSSFTASVPMRIGIAAVGYADGYPRHCSTGTPVLVDGQRTQLVARVSMDMVTLDLTAQPLAQVGSEVTLWGRSGTLEPACAGTLLAVDEVAQAASTLGYELLCALAQRVPVVVD
jgi:alanine racemase